VAVAGIGEGVSVEVATAMDAGVPVAPSGALAVAVVATWLVGDATG
jgi:hypothetical protein